MGGERRRKSPPFVMIYHKWMDAPAFRDLNCYEVALLLHLLRRYNGQNNGEIVLGQRKAAELLNCARGTAARAFEGLERRGFIRPAIKGHFDQKKIATTWRLTMWPAFGKPASHLYRKFKS